MQRPQAKIAQFLGLRPNLLLLCLAVVLIGTGEELWMRFVPKYLESLGASVVIIGLFDGLTTILGAVYAYPGGAVIDRWGHRRSLFAFTALSIAGYVLVAAAANWTVVLWATFLFLSWKNLSLPAMFTLVGSQLPADRHSMGIGLQSLVKRLPILIGPLAGGILIDRLGVGPGVRTGAALSVAAGLAAIIVQNRVRDASIPMTKASGLLSTIRAFDPRLRRLLLSDILIRFCERIPYAWVVIYAMDQAGVSGQEAGLLIGAETLAAMLCYVPASHLADRYGKEPFVVATFALFTLFPFSMLFARTFGMLLVAFTIRGLKEFGEPARKALIIGYAPAETRGRTVGAYYLIRDVTVTAGSFLGAFLWKLGPSANFLAAGAIGVLGTAVYVMTLNARRTA